VGLLTLDALEPGRFDRADLEAVAGFASLAAAAIHTAELIETLERLAEARGQLAQDLVQDELRRSGGTLVGRSPAMLSLQRELDTVAPSDLTVLLLGETGTGKELAARSVHDRSARRERPLVYVNCAALPESVAESELFGHEEGAFTGAVRRRLGKFQLADGGTIFLDEVGELPISIQTKILRTLQFQEVQPVGSDDVRRVDIRVIAATNRQLEEEARRGRFRLDLYHRLAVFPVRLAPLRERREDIALLAGHFLDRARLKLGVGRLRFSPAAVRRLEAHDWPGNVRELEHVVTRAVLRAGQRPGGRTTSVEVEHLQDALGPAPEPGPRPPRRRSTCKPG
jgi:anaerobic nitric oxide reductase transcription regulator